MLTVKQHLAQNKQYENETKECAVVQVKAQHDGSFMDFSRTDVRNARVFVKGKQRIGSEKDWRVVDWITREEIDMDDLGI